MLLFYQSVDLPPTYPQVGCLGFGSYPVFHWAQVKEGVSQVFSCLYFKHSELIKSVLIHTNYFMTQNDLKTHYIFHFSNGIALQNVSFVCPLQVREADRHKQHTL